MAQTPMDQLKQHLSKLSEGPIADDDDTGILLALAWESLSQDGGGMTGDNILGRTEKMQWNPPFLTFQIERHGGTVRGSTRATIQRWTVDIEAKSASHDDSGFRQVRQRAKPLNVERLARKVAQLVSDGSSDNRLNWYTEGRVRVRVSKIIPKDDTPQQTLVGRRKRFHAALVKVLQGKGWEQIKRDVYVRRSDPPAR